MKKSLALFSALAFMTALVACDKIYPQKTAQTEPAQSFSENQKKEVTALIEKYIWENPQKIIDSFNNMQREKEMKRQAEAQKQLKDVLPEIYKDALNPVLGNKDAAYTIVKFYDYGCGYCKKMSKMMVEPVIKNGNIRMIFVETPIFGENSSYAARMAMASVADGKFKEFHEALIDTKDLSAQHVEKIAKDLGLDVEKLKAKANSKEYKDKMMKNIMMAQKLGMNGVPMFILDGQIQPGAFSQEKLNDVFEQANKKAGK